MDEFEVAVIVRKTYTVNEEGIKVPVDTYTARVHTTTWYTEVGDSEEDVMKAVVRHIPKYDMR